MNNDHQNNLNNPLFEEEYMNEALISNSKIKPINNTYEILKSICKIEANI